MDKIAIFALYLLKDMVCVLSLLCLVIGLLAAQQSKFDETIACVRM